MKIKKDLAIGLLAGLAIAAIAFSWWYYAQLPISAKPSETNATSTKPQAKNNQPPASAVPKVTTPAPLPVVDGIDSILVNILAINGSKSRVEQWSGASCLKSKDISGIKFTSKTKFNFDSYLKGRGFVADNQCAADGTIGGLAGYIRKTDGAYCSVEWLKNDVINGIEFKIACEYAI